jgi:hypothetical protein
LLFHSPKQEKHYFLNAFPAFYAFWGLARPPAALMDVPGGRAASTSEHKKQEKHLKNKVFLALDAEKARKAFKK